MANKKSVGVKFRKYPDADRIRWDCRDEVNFRRCGTEDKPRTMMVAKGWKREIIPIKDKEERPGCLELTPI